ncbi:ANTAR domain-containing protein [Pseudonocardia sp. KRD291]|uniref:ANTAR domain-containing protein n=1 Tax=Pseudonocardia sp. KRD291 TaxID=2792007 RepID=UPI001C4A1F6B|nr:ANTAR domain-containing protein [Pseudonocardia sp. KRD291]MBW0105298.1 ANTAR domain-containing protein [Pseudonocardia sp. KRD291]
MNQPSASPLSEDQLRESPTVHLATGMIAAERDLSCTAAFEVLHERALDRDLSLLTAAHEVVRRDTPSSGGGGSTPAHDDCRPAALGRGRWMIRNAQDLVRREDAGRR